jgi:hypothetical protein
MAEARAASSLGFLPPLILTATEHVIHLIASASTSSCRLGLAALQSSGRHQIVQGASHDSLIDDREESLIA